MQNSKQKQEKYLNNSQKTSWHAGLKMHKNMLAVGALLLTMLEKLTAPIDSTAKTEQY